MRVTSPFLHVLGKLPFQLGRKGQCVDVAELADVDLGVNLRGGRLGVSAYLLDEADIR